MSSRLPRRPQASITVPTDHRRGLASDLHLIRMTSFLVIFVMHSSVLLLEKVVLFKHCF